MSRCISLIVLFALATLCRADDQLPSPHYSRQPSDPEWLAQAVQFHGHLGPSAIAGVRIGMIGLRAVAAKGYFDVEVTCEGPFVKPPQSCFLDGLQVGTGATLGKRSLTWVKADRTVIRVKNTKSGKTVELRPTSELTKLLASFKPHSHAGPESDEQQLAAIARKIASLPEKDVVTIAESARSK